MRLTRGVATAVTSVAAVIGIAVTATGTARAETLTVPVGHHLVTTVSGFAPNGAVQRRLDNVPLAGTVRADRRGTVHVRLSAPAQIGRHRLLLIGPVASLSGARAAAAGTSNAPAADSQVVVVVVPLLATVDFRVTPGLGTDGAAVRPVERDSGPGSADIASTADTGVNSLLLLTWGAVLVVPGFALTALGRKRRVKPVAGGSAYGPIA